MKMYNLLGVLALAASLAACQSTPRQFNGNTGYQVENKSANSATISYTLANRANQDLDQRKLQRACQSVLGTTKTYTLSILSINEIPNTAANRSQDQGIAIRNSRMSFGLSDSPSLNNSEGYATREALEARPSTLKVVRYTCS
ncbi:hypothetical protein [Acinetobacter soli]|uniref:hypothetical protein n=1 Tax=Acinetobacter soli TaxID=487316 RepID=UPI000CE513E6|nr:hypothetical protein [Acinetobacter soli]PPB87854.1 hypothetical protein AsoHEU7_04010 [Acinetobacter soli]WEI12234.1 hypothetical protein PX667_12650 [Acinetobacter soli]WEI16248.1 hypothetical protein PX668_05460 [Acinetobacter soli]